jgi:hypothetical protein
MILGLQLKVVVNVTSTRMMFKWSNKVTYIQPAQNNEFVLNFFEVVALENLTTFVIVVIEQLFGKEGFTSAQRDGNYFGIRCLIDLLLYQLLTIIHNLYTYHLQ